MKIAILSENVELIDRISSYLNESGYKVVTFSTNPSMFIQTLEAPYPDVVLVDYDTKEISGPDVVKEIKKKNPNIVTVLLIPEVSPELVENGIEAGADDFMCKDWAFPKFQIRMRLLKRMIKSNKKEAALFKKLREDIQYKNFQENLAMTKHSKIIKNELSMFFEDDNLIETYYKPKDILSGDTIFSIWLGRDRYVMGIIDAMGKGLSASLTSVNATSFLEYSIKKAAEYNDFSFNRSIRDFINYTKAILLEKEMLSAILIYIEGDNIHYANFGMPPIYTPEEKLISNNHPINILTKNFRIDCAKLPKNFFALSDGLIESPMKESHYPYYAKFIKIYKNANFLKDLAKDFEEYAIQKDDVSIIHFKKDEPYEEIFEYQTEIADKSDIDKTLKDFFMADLPQKNKIIYILQELLMNTLEHSVYNMKNKKQHLSYKDMEKVRDSTKVKIDISKKDEYIKFIYEEDSHGFDLNVLNELVFSKYHGRGLKIVRNLSEALFFNRKGNKLKIFLKDKK